MNKGRKNKIKEYQKSFNNLIRPYAFSLYVRHLMKKISTHLGTKENKRVFRVQAGALLSLREIVQHEIISKAMAAYVITLTRGVTKRAQTIKKGKPKKTLTAPDVASMYKMVCDRRLCAGVQPSCPDSLCPSAPKINELRGGKGKIRMFTEGSFKNMLLRAGVERIGRNVYLKIHTMSHYFLCNVLKSSIIVTESRNAKTLSRGDVLYAAKGLNLKLYPSGSTRVPRLAQKKATKSRTPKRTPMNQNPCKYKNKIYRCKKCVGKLDSYRSLVTRDSRISAWSSKADEKKYNAISKRFKEARRAWMKSVGDSRTGSPSKKASHNKKRIAAKKRMDDLQKQMKKAAQKNKMKYNSDAFIKTGNGVCLKGRCYSYASMSKKSGSRLATRGMIPHLASLTSGSRKYTLGELKRAMRQNDLCDAQVSLRASKRRK